MKRLHEKDSKAFLLPRFRGKAPVRTRKVTQPEATTLAEVCAFLDSEGIEWFHMPEWLLSLAFAVEKGNADARMREAAADVRGLPDLLLFHRGRYVALELKTEIGEMSLAQRSWKARLGTLVCRTTAEACQAIREWKAICES